MSQRSSPQRVPARPECAGAAGRRRRARLAVGVALALSALLSGGCRDGRIEAVYPLSDHAPDAKPDDAELIVSFLRKGFDQRRTIVQPPSVFRYDRVPSGDGAYLTVAPALAPAAQGKPGDGVGIELRCTGVAGEWRALLTRRLTPAEGGAGGWQTERLPLDECSSPETSIELTTDCGPANDCRYDATAWGDPKVVYRRPFTPPVGRLVLLISIDTLRPDHLGLYGYGRPTSPRLSELAADSVVFETAVAPAPWTIPSHASMLTSTHPDLHAATSEHDIRPALPLVSEVLHGAGWTTAGFVDTPWLGRFGFDRGYDHYDAASPPRGSFRRGCEATRQRLVDWLDGASGDTFVFWHLMDVHGPYGSPAPAGGRFRGAIEVTDDGRLAELSELEYHNYLRLDRFRSFDDLVAAYDEGILHVDDQVGRLLDTLRAAGLYDDALIVVTSDHGESLLDHGIWVGHGIFLTEDEIRVPLLVKLPGNRHAGTRVEEMVRLLDVAPTILDVAGVEAPSTFEGLSLVSPSPGAPGALPRVAFGVSSNTGGHYVRHNRWKLISAWRSSAADVVEKHLRANRPTPLTARVVDGERLFNLATDPTERHDLSATAEAQEVAGQLRRQVRSESERLDRIGGLLGQATAVDELTEEQIRQLKSLGYLGGVER